MSSIEKSITNVCGISQEETLRNCAFNPDELVSRYYPLAERLKPMRRKFKWLMVGPLSFTKEFIAEGPHVYPAGDALGFIDPFTGSGILNALLTGALAGQAAAR